MTIMTRDEVCEYLRIKTTTFYTYKKQGMPTHYANGHSGRVYCYKEEIDEWLRGGDTYDREHNSIL